MIKNAKHCFQFDKALSNGVLSLTTGYTARGKRMLHTIEEVAKILRVSEATVRRLIKSGQLEAIQVGSQYRISQEELDRFLSRGKK